MKGIATIGLIGAGHIGSQIARLAVANGYDIVISNSRGPETLSALVAELGPRARAATSVDAAKAGDIVVTVPLKNYRAVPVEPLVGKIVIDTNNYSRTVRWSAKKYLSSMRASAPGTGARWSRVSTATRHSRRGGGHDTDQHRQRKQTHAALRLSP